MPPFHKHYGPAVGPLGFPMTDRAARALDGLLKALPKTGEYEYRKAVVSRPPTELNPGERSDVSWISTESVDRAGEVVVARGMNDGQFQHNPLVTLGHAYHLPPVGRSLWRKRVKDGSLAGIKAKTHYPARPDSWPAADPWPPDKVFALVQAGMLQGKSIGFLPTRVHVPDDQEVQRHGWQNVGLVIDEWLLLEYACVFLPANQDALVEAVSKGSVDVPQELLAALGLDESLFSGRPEGGAGPVLSRKLPDEAIPFTPLEEVERHVRRGVEAIDFEKFTKKVVEEAWYKLTGRV
jgi:hypothetical protein